MAILAKFCTKRAAKVSTAKWRNTAQGFVRITLQIDPQQGINPCPSITPPATRCRLTSSPSSRKSSMAPSATTPRCQRLPGTGIRAAAVPTVLYSNTPHYDTIHGGAIPADWFRGYLADLDRRRALDATRAIILGYLGSAEQADILADWLDAEKARRPQLHISIDPVLGDHDSGL